RALGFITNGITPLDNKGNRQWPKIGDNANMIFVNSSCSAESVGRISERKAVLFNGNIVSGVL
ncbi:MAG: putative deaminase with metallo-dependent hydrolase domain, partial [Bacillota bacterium]|nr:putative deaminase with metallo-dependent hydrolase domain [Bacillota bacterium]